MGNPPGQVPIPHPHLRTHTTLVTGTCHCTILGVPQNPQYLWYPWFPFHYHTLYLTNKLVKYNQQKNINQSSEERQQKKNGGGYNM